MKTLYTNTCPSFHDTRKISRDKWLQNVRGEGMASTAGGLITYPETRPQFHDTKNITLQKINQLYCLGEDSSGCVPRWDVGRVAYWDAGSIPDVDFVGSRVMATEDGTPVLVAGKRGNAWEFTAGASMTAPDDSGLRLVNETFVVRFWIKIVTLPPVNGDIVTKLDTPTFSGWGVRMTSAGQLLFVIGNGSTFLSFNGPVVPNDAAFHHIAFTFNVSTQELRGHLDGVLTHSLTNSQLVVASNTEVLRVGGGASQPDHGFAIDELAIWNTYWDTDCQVPADFNCLDCGVPEEQCYDTLATGLVAYWDLNSEDNVDDIGARVMTNGADASMVPAKIGNGASFPGTSDSYLSTPDDAALRLFSTGDFTIRFWVYVDAITPTTQTILEKLDILINSGWAIIVNESNAGLTFYGYSAAWGLQGPTTGPFPAAQWVHVVISARGGLVQIYFNAVSQLGAANPVPVIDSGNASLHVGRFIDDSNPAFNDTFGRFVGRLDEILIADSYGWTADDVSCDYNSGSGRTYPFT